MLASAAGMTIRQHDDVTMVTVIVIVVIVTIVTSSLIVTQLRRNLQEMQ